MHTLDYSKSGIVTAKANTVSCSRDFQDVHVNEWSNIPLETETHDEGSNSAPELGLSIIRKVNAAISGFTDKAKADNCKVEALPRAQTQNLHCTNENEEDNDNAQSVAESVGSSVQSQDPCRDMVVGPRQPPHPSGPFVKQVRGRVPNFKLSGSQHNAEAVLNCQHPYQNIPESEYWVDKLKSWFYRNENEEHQPPTWPQPITFNVANSINQSSSSFIAVNQDSPELVGNSRRMVYTPQALPLGAEKQQTTYLARETRAYWCA